MIIQLPNGESIKMSEEQYFSMSDEQFNIFIWKHRGKTIEDPFYESPIKAIPKRALTEEEVQLMEEFGLPDDIDEDPIRIDSDFLPTDDDE